MIHISPFHCQSFISLISMHSSRCSPHAFSPRLNNALLSHGARTENNTKEGERPEKKEYRISNLNVQCRSQSGAKYRTLPSRNERELNAMAQKCYVLTEKLATPLCFTVHFKPSLRHRTTLAGSSYLIILLFSVFQVFSQKTCKMTLFVR